LRQSFGDQGSRLGSIAAEMGTQMVRRLTVINAPTGEDAEAAARPPWSWVVIGGVLVLIFFLPASLAGLWLGARLSQQFGENENGARLAGALPQIVAFALASWSAGALVGRFGGATRPRHGLAAGALGASFAVVPSLLGRVPASVAVALGGGLVLIGLGSLLGWVGARYGIRRRP
jgi:hypothetical protein